MANTLFFVSTPWNLRHAEHPCHDSAQVHHKIRVSPTIGLREGHAKVSFLARTNVLNPVHAFCGKSVSGTGPIRASTGLKMDQSCELIDSEQIRVLLVGGTGRVGTSTASFLQENLPTDKIMKLFTGTRTLLINEAREFQDKGKVEFVQLDITNENSMMEALNRTRPDIVIHTAGPFQFAPTPQVLEAVIAYNEKRVKDTNILDSRIMYMDVCDDKDYAEMSKERFQRAAAANVIAIICTGIYPGVSNLMAKECSYRAAIQEGHSSNVKSIQYSYYTAGSGGLNATILASTFLLLATPVTIYENGKPILKRPASGTKYIDFGPTFNRKLPAYLLELPEVFSTYTVLKPKFCSARFGTAPQIWNILLQAMVAVIPAKLLGNRDFAIAMAQISMPFVKFTDKITGFKTAIRVDLETDLGTKVEAYYVHNSLNDCVGASTAAFAVYMIKHKRQLRSGVWYPEEAVEDSKGRNMLLELAAKNTLDYRFVVNHQEM